MVKPDGYVRNTTANHISFQIFFVMVVLVEEIIMEAFFQNKTFKTIVIIGLALKSLEGIGIKSHYQTHSLTSFVDFEMTWLHYIF